MILVTGASGMLGRELAGRFGKNEEVLGVSKSGRLNTAVCDLTSQTAVAAFFENKRFGLVIHTAAFSDVDLCEKDPAAAHAANALSTKYLAQQCGRHRIPFVYISTDYVFDGRKPSDYEAGDVTCPVNVYGLTKLEGEFHAKHWTPFSAVVRTSWLFGAGNPKNFVNWGVAALKEKGVVSVLDDQEDSPTYAADLAAAVEKIANYLKGQAQKKPETPCHLLFQVCNAGSASRYEMLLAIRDLLGLKVDVRRTDRRHIRGRVAVRPVRNVMSSRSYEDFFGDRMRPWRESLRDYIQERVLCGS